MNDTLDQQQPTEVEFDELAALKARADLMGIKYHPSTGIDKLKAKIDLQLSGGKESEVETSPTKSKPSSKDYMTQKEYEAFEFKRRKSNAARLVRVRVTCMNPAKKEWDGEIISVGSAKIGTFKKFVKFNTEDGWHIPNIIYEYIKERKCSIFYTEKNQVGQKVRKAKLVNEFNIEVLPPLTKDELKALAQRQAMEAGVDL
jgi:hypothetical protein